MGDIGGTNARLQLSALGRRRGSSSSSAATITTTVAEGTVLLARKDYATAEYDSLLDVVEVFLGEHTDVVRPSSACFAVAGTRTVARYIYIYIAVDTYI